MPRAPAIVLVLLLGQPDRRIFAHAAGLLVAGCAEFALFVQRPGERLDVLLRITADQEAVPEIACAVLSGKQVALGNLQDIAAVAVRVGLRDAMAD